MARVRQVVVQLLDNALKYAPEGSSVRVTGYRDHHPSRPVAIRVHDQGPGIDAAHAGEIFEPYRRMAGGPGSGLGLAIARAVTALMDGEVSVENPGERGAAFLVRLPAT